MPRPSLVRFRSVQVIASTFRWYAADCRRLATNARVVTRSSLAGEQPSVPSNRSAPRGSVSVMRLRFNARQREWGSEFETEVWLPRNTVFQLFLSRILKFRIHLGARDGFELPEVSPAIILTCTDTRADH